jgi:hypothetical protein
MLCSKIYSFSILKNHFSFVLSVAVEKSDVSLVLFLLYMFLHLHAFWCFSLYLIIFDNVTVTSYVQDFFKSPIWYSEPFRLKFLKIVLKFL